MEINLVIHLYPKTVTVLYVLCLNSYKGKSSFIYGAIKVFPICPDVENIRKQALVRGSLLDFYVSASTNFI